MRAERAAAHRDVVAAGQRAGDVGGGDAVDHERGHAEAVDRRARPEAEQPQAWHVAQASQQRARQLVLLGREQLHAVRRERVAGGAEGDGADDVGRAGLEARRRVGPLDAVERDAPHGTAAGEQRRGAGEPRPARDESARSERGVELVARERDVVDAEAAQVERAMRRELRGVGEELGAVRVGQRRQRPERPDLAGHVGGAGHGNEVVAPRAQPFLAAGEQLVGRLG